MYTRIKKHKSTLQLYTDRLVKDGLIPEGEIEDMKAAFQAFLNDEFETGKTYKPNKADWLDGRWSHMNRKGEEYQRGQTAIAPTMAEIGTRADPRARRLQHPQDRRAPAGRQERDVRQRQGLRLGHRRGAGLRQSL